MTVIASTSVLTPADVAGQVSTHGLDVHGLTAPVLARVWASATPGALDEATLRLSLTAVSAPFTGTYEVQATPVTYAALDGSPITAPAGVLRLHPEAVHRLETMVRARLGSLDRPVPVAMLVHGVVVPGTPAPMDWFRAGDPIGPMGSSAVSFHDRRGWIIDPLAVASLVDDLLTFRPALAGASPGAVTDAGGVRTIAGLATAGVRVHVVSPHGAAYRTRRPDTAMEVLDSGGALARTVPASGIVDLTGTEQIGRVAGAGRPGVWWGQAPGGTLDSATWTPAALPAGVTLRRQFLRLVAVDPQWHLLGNRNWVTGDATLPAETDQPANAPLPVVRESIPGFAFLLDGNDVLGAMGSVVSGWPAAADRRMLLCSPRIDPSLALPPAAGAGGHWPAVPAGPAPSPADTAAVRRYAATAATAPTATWATPGGGDPRDVIVTLPAGSLPPGTFVRVYPRMFRVITGIGADPSFVRGDGGSGIVGASGGTSVLVPNALGLGPAEPLPAAPVLQCDIVAVARDGTRRLVGRVRLPIGAAVAWVSNLADFGGTVPPVVAAILAAQGMTSIAPASTFGITPSSPPPATPALTDPLLTWVRWLTNEGSWPRVGPHLPSQARFETILAAGSVLGGAAYTWDTVLSGARFDWESRCSSPELGDPGNPAGVDSQLTGVRVGGQLAYDLAFHALKRCQSIVPGAGGIGWGLFTGGTNWDVPPPDPAPAAGAAYLAGAMLETISAVTDSPELSLLDVPADTDSLSSLANTLATALGIPGQNVFSVTLANEPRLRRQLQREIATAKRGQRDAMWSIARAVAEASEYVLIETPAFWRTARVDATHPETGLVDLVDVLADRLGANPRLKVLLCVPRLPDVAQATWMRAAFKERKSAIEALTGDNLARVAAFHPIGFPGRDTVGRSTTVLVDDVYAVVGTSHWRRRGMSFDGGCDVATLDRRLDDRGVGPTIAAFRQRLLASRLGIAVPTSASNTSALWTRLAEPEAAFDLVRDLLAGGGLGRCWPVYAGPTDTTVIPEDIAKVDPNGITPQSLISLLGGLVP